MKSFYSRPLFFALMLFGMGAMFHANVSHARVTCANNACTWNPDWGSRVGIRITIGTDQNGVQRFVVSQLRNPAIWKTATIKSGHTYHFLGTEVDDVMVEVQKGGPSIVHGSYTLSAPNGIKAISFYSGDYGNDVVVGGTYTKYISAGYVNTPVTRIFIMQPSDLKQGSRDVFGSTTTYQTSSAGTDWMIVGPAFVSGADTRNISLNGWYGNEVMCNLTNTPVDRMANSSVVTDVRGDVRFGPVLKSSAIPENADLGTVCYGVWVAIMSAVYEPVQ